MSKRRRFIPIKKFIFSFIFCIILLINILIVYDIFSINSKIEYCFIKTSSLFGFNLSNIIIVGNKHTQKNIIKDCIGIDFGSSIFTASVNDIKRNLELINWVKDAHVARWLPFTLFIKINERIPMALWHKHGLVDVDGEIIECNNHPTNIITIIGDDAPIHFPVLLKILKQFEKRFKENNIPKIKIAFILRNKRWNIILENRCILKLSKYNIESSLNTFIENFYYLKNKYNINNIKSIDLRFKDTIILEMK